MQMGVQRSDRARRSVGLREESAIFKKSAEIDIQVEIWCMERIACKQRTAVIAGRFVGGERNETKQHEMKWGCSRLCGQLNSQHPVV